MTLFFGYGSTLDAASWPNGTITMKSVGPARLPDNVLAFDYRSSRRQCGALNLRKRLGGVVEGYLFDLGDASLARLDAREGHPNFYVREDVVVLNPDGREVRAVTYRVAPHRLRNFTPPNEEYINSCMSGRARFDLPTDDIEAALENRESVCDAVFTYGTLMRGEQRASSWKDLETSCTLLARSFGTLHDDDTYPGFVPGRSGLVEGDFIRFGAIDQALTRFDRVEGFMGFGSTESLFRRTLVDVDVGGGRIRRAWTYATMRPEAPRIAGDDWRKARGSHAAAMSAILSAHAASDPLFFDRLANVSDGPFGTVCEQGAGYKEILGCLTLGGFDERGLSRASGIWNAWA